MNHSLHTLCDALKTMLPQHTPHIYPRREHDPLFSEEFKAALAQIATRDHTHGVRTYSCELCGGETTHLASPNIVEGAELKNHFVYPLARWKLAQNKVPQLQLEDVLLACGDCYGALHLDSLLNLAINGEADLKRELVDRIIQLNGMSKRRAAMEDISALQKVHAACNVAYSVQVVIRNMSKLDYVSIHGATLCPEDAISIIMKKTSANRAEGQK